MGHVLGLNDLDDGFDYGTHKALMGYNRFTNSSTLNDAITYHYIQGAAVVNGLHKNHSFYRYYVKGITYVNVCFYCDYAIKTIIPYIGSLPFTKSSDCSHNYKPMVSFGEKDWLKCTNCYKVIVN